MGIILGLSAALFWGTADFLVRYSTRIIGTYRTLFYMQFIGLASLSIFLVASGEFARLAARVGWQWWILAILTALLNVVSALALYRSFEVGVLAIVSPIAASSTALTVVLAIISGELISRARGLGSGSLEQDGLLSIVAMQKEEQTGLVHHYGLGKRQGHAHKTG